VENPTSGYTRIQGALKNVGHRVGRSTIGGILKAHGLPPVPERPTSWQAFLRAHWGAIAEADFFTTEVWTWRGGRRTRMRTRSASSDRSKKSASTADSDERHFRHAVREFVEHYHGERNHQGLQNALIAGAPAIDTAGRVHRRPRLGGLLNYDERAA